MDPDREYESRFGWRNDDQDEDVDVATLRALLAEAAKALGPFARIGDLIVLMSETTEKPFSFSEYADHFRVARTVKAKIEEAGI